MYKIVYYSKTVYKIEYRKSYTWFRRQDTVQKTKHHLLISDAVQL